MTRQHVLCSLLFALTAGPLPADDLESLQGLWISLDDPWSVEFRGDTAHFQGTHAFSESYQGRDVPAKLRYTLDAEAIPKGLDLNADDFAAFKASRGSYLGSAIQRRMGIYQLENNRLTLQFGSRERPKNFWFSEGAPANHAWPLSRNLRRISPEDLERMQRLTGVWRGVLERKGRVLEVDVWLIRPGWMQGLMTSKIRYRLLPGEPEEILLHRYVVERGRNLFGGSYTSYDWEPSLGTIKLENGVLTAELNDPSVDPRLDDEAFQVRADLTPNEIKSIRDPQRQKPGLDGKPKKRPAATLRLERITEDIAIFGPEPQLHEQFKAATKDQMTGAWKMLLRKDVRSDNFSSWFVPAFDPPVEQWTFAEDGWDVVADEDKEHYRVEWKERGAVWIFRGDQPDKKLGTLDVKYEPVSGLLFVQRQQRLANDEPVGRQYFFERVKKSDN